MGRKRGWGGPPPSQKTQNFLKNKKNKKNNIYIVVVCLYNMPKRRLKLTEEDKNWAAAVKDRDNWQCVICGSNIRPNAHHLLPRELKEFKHSLWNGITLCPNHHMFSRKISAHNNPIAFCKWLLEHRPEEMEVVFSNVRT